MLKRISRAFMVTTLLISGLSMAWSKPPDSQQTQTVTPVPLLTPVLISLREMTSQQTPTVTPVPLCRCPSIDICDYSIEPIVDVARDSRQQRGYVPTASIESFGDWIGIQISDALGTKSPDVMQLLGGAIEKLSGLLPMQTSLPESGQVVPPSFAGSYQCVPAYLPSELGQRTPATNQDVTVYPPLVLLGAIADALGDKLNGLLPAQSTLPEPSQALPAGRYVDLPSQHVPPTLAGAGFSPRQSTDSPRIPGEGMRLDGLMPSAIYDRVNGSIGPRDTPQETPERPAATTRHPLAGALGGAPVQLAIWRIAEEVTEAPQFSCCPEHVMDAETFRIHAATRYYEIARECELKGDFAMARNCYEEAARMCPDTSIGSVANARVAQLHVADAGWRIQSGVEVQQEPPQQHKDINNNEGVEPGRLLESWRMLQMGERYRSAGDLENAFRCFQSSYAICPASRYGQSALDRMIEVERTRSNQQQELQRRQRPDGVEEQEMPMVQGRLPMSPDMEQRLRAYQLFLLAERCLEQGDCRTAYGLYQETHLACPDCPHGMKAIERMCELEKRRLQSPDGGNR